MGAKNAPIYVNSRNLRIAEIFDEEAGEAGSENSQGIPPHRLMANKDKEEIHFMQKKLVLAAAVAGVLAAPTAFAQSTIYGHLDIGVQLLDAGEGYDGSETFVADQQGSGGSFVGWRANDDLGGGLTGLAVVEVGFFTDTGNFDNAGGVQFAQRQVYAGLQGGFGTVTAGRQYREAFLVGAAGSYNYTAAGIGVFFLNTFTGVRQSNFIKYASPTMGGLNFVVGYSPEGGTTGPTEDDGTYTEFGVKYAAGPLRVGAVFGTETGTIGGSAATSGVDADVIIVGGQFSLSPATTLYGIFTSGETSDDAFEASSLSVGVKQTIGSGDLVVQAGQLMVDRAGGVAVSDADSTLIGVGYYHRMSKQTTVYAAFGTVDNDTNGDMPAPRQAANVTTGAINNPGEDPSTISFGIRRTF